MNSASRAPKLLGDFGEGLVTYVLIRQGYEVAVVDHVGADLIAEQSGRRYAISVKTRLFRAGSRESRTFVIEHGHLEKLAQFAARFSLSPLFAQVVCLADQRTIHVLVLPAGRLDELLPLVKHGYALRLQREADLTRITSHPAVAYARFTEEQLRAAAE